MDVKKYNYGINLIYEVENLSKDIYFELANMVNSDYTLISVDSKDFELICYGYKKVMIGFGKIEEIDSLLNFYDLYKNTESIIVQFIVKDFASITINNALNKIRDFFHNDLNIICSVDCRKEDYDIVLFVPVIKITK